MSSSCSADFVFFLFGGTPEEATFYTWWSKHRLLEQKAPECRQIFWLDSRWDGQTDRLIKLVGLPIAFLSWDWRKKSGLFVWDVRICSREKRPKGPTCNNFFFVVVGRTGWLFHLLHPGGTFHPGAVEISPGKPATPGEGLRMRSSNNQCWK